MSAPDEWARWPDDFMCPIAEVEDFVSGPWARSDDFERVNVLTYDESGEPATWERAA